MPTSEHGYYTLYIEFYLVEILVVVVVASAVVEDAVVVTGTKIERVVGERVVVVVTGSFLTQHLRATRWTCLKGRHDSQMPLSSSFGFSTQT